MACAVIHLHLVSLLPFADNMENSTPAGVIILRDAREKTGYPAWYSLKDAVDTEVYSRGICVLFSLLSIRSRTILEFYGTRTTFERKTKTTNV